MALQTGPVQDHFIFLLLSKNWKDALAEASGDNNAENLIKSPHKGEKLICKVELLEIPYKCNQNDLFSVHRSLPALSILWCGAT